MGKRSDFPRRERDFYVTPFEAVGPLVPYLPPGRTFIEPCIGDGALVRHLYRYLPDLTCIMGVDAKVPLVSAHYSLPLVSRDSTTESFAQTDMFITNPPWSRHILHPLLDNLLPQAPHTVLLIDADWAHTRQATPYLPHLAMIISVGRLKWIPDSKMTGKDNCAWYIFCRERVNETVFIGRT